MLSALKKNNNQPIIRDRLIIFDEDNKTCEILAVEEENEEIVRAGNKTVPKADLTLTLSKQGRVYVLRAPQKIVQLTEHLRRVEMNTIVRQITQYKKPDESEKRIDWLKIGMLIGLIIVAIVAAAK